MDNSTLSAEYGQSSGAVVNVATRSGSRQFHGELFEFMRNNALDARNFFNFTSHEPPPFKRNQFGGTLGGPITRSKTFFFFSYEGLRQAQDLSLNSVVLSDANRAAITDAAAAKLAGLIPRPNFLDSSGTPRLIGWAPGPVRNDQWALDISHILNAERPAARLLQLQPFQERLSRISSATRYPVSDTLTVSTGSSSPSMKRTPSARI